jgi:secondary thiamine-phosphate synthase enzyme
LGWGAAPLASWFDRAAPDGDPAYAHDCEGPDDMPAHIKAVLTGCALSIPVAEGRPQLGTWQGIHLCEFRDHGGPRRVVLTLHGDRR